MFRVISNHVRLRASLLRFASRRPRVRTETCEVLPLFEAHDCIGEHPSVLGVDIGTRNFAFCKVDKKGDILNWGIYDFVRDGLPGVFPPTAEPSIREMAQLVRTPLFTNATAVLIECQIAGQMKVLEAVLHAFLYDKAHIVRPVDVHRYYETVTGDYKANKHAAVGKCLELVASAESRGWLAAAAKRDDLADAYLLARYGHERILQNHALN